MVLQLRPVARAMWHLMIMDVKMKKIKKNMNNEKGLATVETTMLLFIFVLFMGFATGFYSAIHTGILNSISARAYAFEIIRNRANVTYHRNPSTDRPESMAALGFRAHGVILPNPDDLWIAQKVPITIATDAAETNSSTFRPDKATEGVPMPGKYNKANPIWIKTAYGICLDAKCGG